MTTLTKEQLISHARESVSYLEDLKGRVSKEGADCKVVIEMVERDLKLARIALASLEAKPIGAFHIAEQQVDGTSDYIKDGEWPIDNGTIEVYVAPPVPVIQADVAQAIENLKQKLVECNRYNYCADAVKNVEDACHAAMLQGSQPVSQTYKLPVNTPCQDAPAHIWLQTAGVWPEDGELSELTWCSHNQHHDDTLYVRADLVNGNYPATPDSWISCSERMPNDKQYVWCWGKSYAWTECDTFEGYYDWSRNKWWAVTDDGEEPASKVTHWMPLPEPPQEVNRG
ncbi:DUF551 domain-containing protein [Escherichia coli]|nr:DUF551 domain-containing protein [Escherichia coli]